MKVMSFIKSIAFWIVIIVILLVGVVGFMAGRMTAPQLRTVPKQIGDTNTIFTSQSASIRGYVTDIAGNKLKVQNLSGVAGEVEVSNQIIMKKPESKTASATADLKQIELGREALIALELSGGVYKVVSINYLPKLPPTLR